MAGRADRPSQQFIGSFMSLFRSVKILKIVILKNFPISYHLFNKSLCLFSLFSGNQPSNMTKWLFCLMGFICVLCLAAVLHTIKEVRQAEQDTSEN